MFPRRERLTRAQFTTAFHAGTRHSFQHCTIITTPSPTRHVSVVVGKKVAKTAVARNKLRRRVYAQVRSALTPHQATGFYIVLLRPSFASLPRKTANEVIRTSIAQVLKST